MTFAWDDTLMDSLPLISFIATLLISLLGTLEPLILFFITPFAPYGTASLDNLGVLLVMMTDPSYDELLTKTTFIVTCGLSFS